MSIQVRVIVTFVCASASTKREFWKLTDRATEGLALLDVLERQVEHRLARPAIEPTARPRRSGIRWAISWAKPVPSSPSRFSTGTRAVVEEELGRVVGVLATLVDLVAALEALHAALDDDHREALVRVIAGAHGRHDLVGVDAVADEGLGAVDDVVVAVR